MEAEVEAETAEAAMAVDAKNTVAADAWVGVGMDMMQVMAIVVDSVAVAEGVVVLGCSGMFINAGHGGGGYSGSLEGGGGYNGGHDYNEGHCHTRNHRCR